MKALTQTPIEKSLDDALESITIEILTDLEYGEEIKLNEDFTLYHYLEDDFISVNHFETGTELFAIHYCIDTREISFDDLKEDVNKLV